jgi:hypothetical protein
MKPPKKTRAVLALVIFMTLMLIAGLCLFVYGIMKTAAEL